MLHCVRIQKPAESLLMLWKCDDGEFQLHIMKDSPSVAFVVLQKKSCIDLISYVLSFVLINANDLFLYLISKINPVRT